MKKEIIVNKDNPNLVANFRHTTLLERLKFIFGFLFKGYGSLKLRQNYENINTKRKDRLSLQ